MIGSQFALFIIMNVIIFIAVRWNIILILLFCNRMDLSSVSVISGSYGDFLLYDLHRNKKRSMWILFCLVPIEKYETCQCMAIFLFVFIKSRWRQCSIIKATSQWAILYSVIHTNKAVSGSCTVRNWIVGRRSSHVLTSLRTPNVFIVSAPVITRCHFCTIALLSGVTSQALLKENPTV